MLLSLIGMIERVRAAGAVDRPRHARVRQTPARDANGPELEAIVAGFPLGNVKKLSIPRSRGVLHHGRDSGHSICLPSRARHRHKGDKASQKRMATAGAAYTVDRYERTPQEVMTALFRDSPRPEPSRRPEPQHKHVWACLSTDEAKSMDIVYTWLQEEIDQRNPDLTKEMVHLCDGQESLWEARDRYLPQQNSTNILDILHVSSRVWQAAHVFHAEGSAAAAQFARARLLKILQGQSQRVVRGLRVMASKRGLTGVKKKTLLRVCAYLKANPKRMRYHEYLAKGYPIASGIIEGACRHLVKERMERAGMHWTEAGAQAMLDVRSVYVNGQWEAFQVYRIKHESLRLYPFRKLVQGEHYRLVS
jgi:hypothetical protein